MTAKTATWTPQQMLDLLLETESNLEERGWDQHARPFLVVTSGGKLRRQRIDVNMGPWNAQPRPFLVLNWLAKQPVPRALRHRVAAVAIHTEAWMILAHKDNVAQNDQMQAAADRREIYKHPDRIEIRALEAVDRHGHLYSVVRKRGGTPEIWSGLPDDPRGAAYLEGAVPDSLRTYAGAVFGW